MVHLYCTSGYNTSQQNCCFRFPFPSFPRSPLARSWQATVHGGYCMQPACMVTGSVIAIATEMGEFIIHGRVCCGKVNISAIMSLGMSQYCLSFEM